MSIKRRSILLASLTLLPLSGAWAQGAFPNRPVKIVATVPPGTASDTLIRRLGELASKTLGQPVIVENKPGAQSLIAARAVAREPNDGYTLLVGSNTSHAANLYMVKELGYHPVKDFTPIVRLTVNPLLLVVNAELPIRSVPEFIKFAKDRPGKLSYGTGNSGGLVAAQMLKTQTGIEAVGVNYAGTAQAMADLVSGRLDFMVTDPVVVRPFVQSGKLRVIAGTSKQRLSSFPEVIPLAEAGLPGYEYASWVGLFGPSGVPADATRRINQAFVKALAEPAMERFLAENGMISAGSTPEEFQAYVHDQINFWGRLAKDAKLTPQ